MFTGGSQKGKDMHDIFSILEARKAVQAVLSCLLVITGLTVTVLILAFW